MFVEDVACPAETFPSPLTLLATATTTYHRKVPPSKFADTRTACYLLLTATRARAENKTLMYKPRVTGVET